MSIKENKWWSGKWASIVVSIIVGPIVGLIYAKAINQIQNSPNRVFYESLLTGIVATIVADIMLKQWQIFSKTEDLSRKLAEIERDVLSDERIMLARSKDNRSSEVSVIVVENVGIVPGELSLLPQCGNPMWKCSISLLRFDRMQDLIFSTHYLKHFFSLRNKSETQSRILIINDVPRSRIAVQSFLQISEAVGINTYVYRKSEFYNMLEYTRRVVDKKGNQKLQEIFQGNPELNVMVDDPDKFEEWTGALAVISPETDFVLRYMAPNGEVLTKRPNRQFSENASHSNTLLTFKLMSIALTEERKGLPAFERILNKDHRPENPWSLENLKRLTNDKMDATKKAKTAEEAEHSKKIKGQQE